MKPELTKIGKRGTIVIPASLRHHFHFQEGDLIIAEDHGDGILLKPAIAVAVENYTPERRAEFLLSNATDAEDYRQAQEEVRRLGLDPAKIPHYKPKNR